jgi:S1-C subfamily serine protease
MNAIGFIAGILGCLVGFTAHGAGAPQTDTAARFTETAAAMVHVKTRVVPDARTRDTLGTEREGSGIVIDEAGHVLTIGYLVIEAGSVELTTGDGRSVPGTVAGYDHASGFAVVRALAPLGVKPVELGSAQRVSVLDPVLVLGSGGHHGARLAFVVSRRPFTGSWEYLLESAIFTTPPAANWPGSALIDGEGRVVGVGSLLLRNTADDDNEVPGNLFVPVDLVKPILADLIRYGRVRGPARAWLGLAAEELQGHLLVDAVSPGGPAERAGIRSGDIVVAVGDDAVRTRAELYRKVWALGPAGTEVPLRVLQGAQLRDIKLQSMDRLDYLKAAPTY